MLRVFYVLVLAGLLSFPASAQSNPPPSAVNLRVEQLQQQINRLQTELKAVQNNPADHDNLVTLNKGLPDLEKRVEDIHQYVAYWGWFSGGAIALFGILITALIIFFSFRITNEAKIAARLAAEEEASTWFKNKGEAAIQPFLSSLQKEGNEAVNSIFKAGIDTNKKINDEADQQRTSHAEEHQALLDRMNPSSDDKGKTLDSNDVTELHRITEQLRLKPEDQYSFDDWRSRYLEATNRKALDEVSNYVEGMERVATDDWQNTTAKFSRAWLLGFHQQHAEALKLYDEIIDQYSANEEPRLKERVAAALRNKGYTLSQQGQWETAIAVCDELVSRYGACSEAGIAKPVAEALVNKGYELRQQGQWEAAIAVYDDLVSRYGARSEADIAEPVAGALINKGFTLSQQGQWEAAIAVYDDLVSRYAARNEAGIADHVANALYNRAVVLVELKRTFEAKVAYATLIERYASRTESEILARVKDAEKAINELGNA